MDPGYIEKPKEVDFLVSIKCYLIVIYFLIFLEIDANGRSCSIVPGLLYYKNASFKALQYL